MNDAQNARNSTVVSCVMLAIVAWIGAGWQVLPNVYYLLFIGILALVRITYNSSKQVRPFLTYLSLVGFASIFVLSLWSGLYLGAAIAVFGISEDLHASIQIYRERRS